MGANSKGGVANNEVADFPQLFTFSPTFPNPLSSIEKSRAASMSDMSMKKQQLLLQRTQRQRQRMWPTSKNSYNVCKMGRLFKSGNIWHGVFYLTVVNVQLSVLLRYLLKPVIFEFLL